MLKKLQNKKILLGITASIAITKIDRLIELLEANGAEIKIIMTKNAIKLTNQLIAEKRLERKPNFLNNAPKIYVDMFEQIDSKDGSLH